MKLINFGRMVFGFWMGVAVTLRAMSKLLNKLISADKNGILMHAFKDNLADTFEIMLFGAPRSRYDKRAYYRDSYQRHKPDFNEYKYGYHGSTYRTYQQEEREKDDKIIKYLDMWGWDMPDVDAANDLGVTRYDVARCKMRHNRQKQMKEG